MLMNDVCIKANLTKKAVKYYISQALITPKKLNNGYYEFNEDDLEALKKISVLRKLSLSTEQIRGVFNDSTQQTLQNIVVQKEHALKLESEKKALLDKLSNGVSYANIQLELDTFMKSELIGNRILDVFPGYIGQFLYFNFSRFLNMPISTKKQESAYQNYQEKIKAAEKTILDAYPNLIKQ